MAALLAVAWGVQLAAGTPLAAASAGDLVASVPIVTSGVSVAFDGHYLIYTIPGEVPQKLYKINPSNFADQQVVTIVGPGLGDINALSYDATRTKLWAGDDLYNVYLIDPNTGVASAPFNVSSLLVAQGFCEIGCNNEHVDGLAYDSVTGGGTLWYSPDQSQRIYRFDAGDIAGVPILGANSYFDIDDPGAQMQPQCATNQNSGIAATAGTLYLMNTNCADYFFAYGTTTPCSDAFSTICPGTRKYPIAFNPPYQEAEDAECDNVTFRGKNVIWIRNTFSNEIRAYEVGADGCIFGGGANVSPTAARMTGGGYLKEILPDPTHNAYGGFMLHCNAQTQPNRLEVNWGNGERFHMTALQSATCGPTPGSFNGIQGHGTGRYDGHDGALVDFSFTDNGEPGSADQGSITVSTSGGVPIMHAEGLLLGGNYQAHQGGPS